MRHSSSVTSPRYPSTNKYERSLSSMSAVQRPFLLLSSLWYSLITVMGSLPLSYDKKCTPPPDCSLGADRTTSERRRRDSRHWLKTGEPKFCQHLVQGEKFPVAETNLWSRHQGLCFVHLFDPHQPRSGSCRVTPFFNDSDLVVVLIKKFLRDLLASVFSEGIYGVIQQPPL